MGLVFTPKFPSIPGKIETIDKNGVHHLQLSNDNILAEKVENKEPDLFTILTNAYRQGVNEAE